ncbi:MAG: ThuA domain-containing protein [Verrucomicrobia bacterium]|nr:ThuA domain-containing protein [Verrucomicrobiota bacterium]
MKKLPILIAALCFVSPLLATAAETTGPNILFLIGEREYFTEKSLTEFYQNDLKPLGYRATFITAKSNEGPDRNDFPGLIEALKSTDILFVSARRRAPKKNQLNAIRKYLDSGKPLMGIRTTSHAFSLNGKPVPDGCAVWENFDPEVIGGNYNGHFNDDPFDIVTGAGKDHAILKGVKLTKSARLYRSGPLKAGTTTLLVSVAKKDQPSEPLAWTHHYGKNKAKVFYTSMGIVEDFKNPNFRKLLINAVAWAAKD